MGTHPIFLSLFSGAGLAAGGGDGGGGGDQVDVVGHEAVGLDGQAEPGRLLTQQAKIVPAAVVGEEDVLAVVAPACPPV